MLWFFFDKLFAEILFLTTDAHRFKKMKTGFFICSYPAFIGVHPWLKLF